MRSLNEQIAELLGWRDFGIGSGLWERKLIGRPSGNQYRGPVPLWDQDLNLMHELVSDLTKSEYIEYIERPEGMDEIADYDGNTDYDVLRRVTEATAQQKAIAWLKVKAPKGET